jgi:xylan 1,4-beta-xylosidase
MRFELGGVMAAVLTLMVPAMTPVLAQSTGTDAGSSVALRVDARAATTPFPHFWEQTFGSGRAILSLREEYRDDLKTVKQATGFESIRFHGIFMDEVGLYDPNRKSTNPGQTAQEVKTNGIYNFSYIDQIYDGLLANGVKPFVEMSFMPKGLASDPKALHAFWYKQNVSPPKDYAAWDAMIKAFAQHLVDRYGIAEVATWKFEVWNEPNLDFWAGVPKQATYFELYDHTARDLKSVDERIQVGGPATAAAAWVPAFLAHCKQQSVPVDFVSTHVYGNDTAKDVFGAGSKEAAKQIPRNQMVCRAVRHVHDQIVVSPYPKMPLIMSEYNASYANEPDVTDTTYMGPWLAETISQCDGLTEAMSYWDFSDVFEEQGVTRTPFYGGFGLIASDEIPKPALHAFAMLHELGDRRIALDSDSALATRRADGTVVLALWNYAPPYGEGSTYTPPPAVAAPAKSFTVKLDGVRADAAVTVLRLDGEHGNVLKAYDAMGRPADPSREQITTLRKAGQPAAPEHTSLRDGSVTIRIPAQGLAVVTIAK